MLKTQGMTLDQMRQMYADGDLDDDDDEDDNDGDDDDADDDDGVPFPYGGAVFDDLNDDDDEDDDDDDDDGDDEETSEYDTEEEPTGLAGSKVRLIPRQVGAMRRSYASLRDCSSTAVAHGTSSSSLKQMLLQALPFDVISLPTTALQD